MKCKVFVTSTIYPDTLSLLDSSFFEVHMRQDNEPDLTEEDLIRIAEKYDALVCNISNEITSKVITAAIKLKFISNIAVGHDNIDLEAARKKNIIVATTPGTLHRSVAEHAIGLLIMASRKVSTHQQKQRTGNYPKWAPTFNNGLEISNKEIGIIGLGQIGKEIGRILHFGFNAKIFYLKNKSVAKADYPVTPLDMNQFFSQMKLIIIACPLNKKTKYLIEERELNLMQDDSVLINIARGKIINQEALLKYKYKFRGIGLDVTDPDPLPYGHPLLNDPIFFITPHIGSATDESRRAMVQMALRNVYNYMHLEDSNDVNIIN